ncbi:MAG TPA: EthD domain-containing protein [Isosphaeraceae bacterium]|nr:EthD domain-containing protein [Isosphaeraceae bacterium]
MFKVMWLLRRKPGISHEQFKEHYESSHVIMAQKYIGHLLIEYKRNYKTETWGGGVPTDTGGGFGLIDWPYDCVTEWVMKDESALDRINAIFAHPVIGKEFHDDEANFLDRDSVVLIKCQVIDTGPGRSA